MWQFNTTEMLKFTQNGRVERQHIMLRPTQLCVRLAILSILIWIGAANYQVNVAYAVCFWVWGFIGVVALLTWRQLIGLQIEVAFGGEVFAGQYADVSVRMKQVTYPRMRLFWWRSEYDEYMAMDDSTDLPREWQRVAFSGSLNDIFETIWAIPIMCRGYFPQPLCLKLATSAPFGLFHAEVRINWQSEAVAFAAPLAHNDWGAQPDYAQSDQQISIHGDDVAYLTNHQEGVSLQHIAWKVYAKRGELMDKIYDKPSLITSRNEVISYRDYATYTPIDRLAGLLTYRGGR